MSYETSDIERTDAEKVNAALAALAQKDFFQVRRLLEEVVANAPEEYVYSYEEQDKLFIKFWDREEFLDFSLRVRNRHAKKEVEWILSAYPRAYYHLGYIDSEEGKYESALANLRASLKLEPDQPWSFCELAVVYSALGQHEKALVLYDQALTVRSDIPAGTRAVALRGKGVQMVELGQLDFAEECLRESLRFDPTNTIANYELLYIWSLRHGGSKGLVSKTVGNEYLRRAEYEKAIMEYEKASQVEPQNAEVWFYKGFFLGVSGRHDEALKALERVIEINPRYAPAWFGKASTLRYLGRIEEAIEAYESAVGADPNYIDALIEKGVCLASVGRREEAREVFERAAELNPQCAEAWSGKGAALAELGRDEEALRALQGALERSSQLIEVWLNKGIILGKLGRDEEALEACERAIELDPLQGDAWLEKGAVLGKLGRQEEALSACEAAVEIAPGKPEAWFRKSFVLKELRRPEEAIEACHNAWVTLGNAAWELGSYDEAAQAYDKAIELAPKDADTWAAKGAALLSTQKQKEGIKAIEMAIRINPQHTVAWLDKGIALAQLGRYARALEACEKVLEIDPQMVDAWLNKSVILSKLGRHQESTQACVRAREINPGYASARLPAIQEAFDATIARESPLSKFLSWFKALSFFIKAIVTVGAVLLVISPLLVKLPPSRESVRTLSSTESVIEKETIPHDTDPDTLVPRQVRDMPITLDDPRNVERNRVSASLEATEAEKISFAYAESSDKKTVISLMIIKLARDSLGKDKKKQLVMELTEEVADGVSGRKKLNAPRPMHIDNWEVFTVSPYGTGDQTYGWHNGDFVFHIYGKSEAGDIALELAREMIGQQL